MERGERKNYWNKQITALRKMLKDLQDKCWLTMPVQEVNSRDHIKIYNRT